MVALHITITLLLLLSRSFVRHHFILKRKKILVVLRRKKHVSSMNENTNYRYGFSVIHRMNRLNWKNQFCGEGYSDDFFNSVSRV